MLGQQLRDQEDILCAMEDKIVDLDFHMVQAQATMQVLASKLGIQFPSPPPPLASSNSPNSLDASSSSSLNSIFQGAKPPSPEKLRSLQRREKQIIKLDTSRKEAME